MNSITGFLSPRAWIARFAGFRNGSDVESAGLALVGAIPEFQRLQSSTYPTDQSGGVWDAYKAAVATLQPVLLGGKILLGTWPQGYVLRHEGGEKWAKIGRLGLPEGPKLCN